jgi:hypothetical protein
MSNYKRLLSSFNSLEQKIDQLISNKNQKGTKKYLTYKEASEYLGITVEGLKTRIKRGQMFKVVNNNRPLIAFSEIERFLNSQNPKIIREIAG